MSAFDPIVKAYEMEMNNEKGFVTLNEKEIKELNKQTGTWKMIKVLSPPVISFVGGVGLLMGVTLSPGPLSELRIFVGALGSIAGSCGFALQSAIQSSLNKQARWMLKQGVRPLEAFGPLPEIPVTEVQKRSTVLRPAPFPK